MKSSPEISIITPVWNGLPFLQEAITSVLNQNFTNWEMIIGDDGSTDGSREYLNTFNDERIKVYKHEKNKGIFGNINFLFEHTTAPYSQILCQDDYFIAKDSLAKIIDYWQNSPADIYFATFNHKAANKSSTELLQQRECPPVIEPQNAALMFYIFANIPGNLSNVSLRNSIWQKVGVFREDLPYAGDFEFWSRAAMLVKMGVNDEMVTYVRRHPGVASVFLNKKGELIAQKSIIINELFDNIISKHNDKSFILKLHGTAAYDTLQRDPALRLLLRGKTNYLNELNKVSKTSNYVLNFYLRWLLYFVTAGGRVGRATIAKYVLYACKS